MERKGPTTAGGIHYSPDPTHNTRNGSRIATPCFSPGHPISGVGHPAFLRAHNPPRLAHSGLYPEASPASTPGEPWKHRVTRRLSPLSTEARASLVVLSLPFLCSPVCSKMQEEPLESCRRRSSSVAASQADLPEL
jgi:hypothetical protein